MPDRRPRIDDVAREANVSTGTVSRVINGQASVSPRRREAVLAAISRLGYRPHPIARALRSGRTHTIGITVRTLRNNSVAEFVETILETVAPHGYAVSVSDTIMSRRFEQTSVEDFLERNFDALVTLNPYSLRPYIKAHHAGAKVLSVFSPRPGRHFPFTAMHLDFDPAATEALERLYKCGHRSINFIAPPSAYRRNPLVHLPYVSDGRIKVTHLADNPRSTNGASEEHLVNHILSGDPTALIVRSESAPRVLAALQHQNVEVPRDISFIVWGRAGWRDLVTPALSAVEVDYHEVGKAAGEILLAMLRDGTPDPSPRFPGQFVETASIGPARIRKPR